MIKFYPTTSIKRENVLSGIDDIFQRLKIISEERTELEQLEFHDMLKEGFISPHCYYTAKYKYKNLILDTGTLFDSHIGASRWCTISAPKKEMYMLYKGVEVTDIDQLPSSAKEDYKNMEYSIREIDEYEIVCEMRVQDTNGFQYEWKQICEYREEIERLLFPEIYDSYDKAIGAL